jgi:phage pi2 protein 07
MSYEFESKEYRGCKIRIVQEEHAESPREWDNLGHLLMERQRNYRLGDEQSVDPFRKLLDFATDYFDAIERLTGKYPDVDSLSVAEDPESFDAMLRYIDMNYAILGVSFRDHGSHGCRLSTHPITQFDDDTDGIIYAPHDKIKEWLGKDKSWDELRTQAVENLKGEIETYENYLNGIVAGWIAEDEEGEEIESCWGYYPDEKGDWSDPISEAESSIDHHLKHQDKLAIELCANI